ncbi:hypothetical protein IFM89_021085 [Coptis chinensis]|uniref:Uncharacterized protein n=1 Tax=Coptis chinensis TaxID=261450 RepID=A0A835HXE4_9MAGN|nr:hypothetical protein IFM89_021085 [Coptis chinensis]
MSYEKTIRALSGHFEGRAMSYEKTIRALSLHFEGTAKSYEKTIRALSLHFEGTTKSYEKTIRELSMHFEGRYVVSTPYLCNTGLILHWDYPNICSRKRSFHLAQLLVPFFESITKQVIPEDLLAVHSEIVRAGEAGSDADVSEDMHCDESVSGVQEGSNDMSSKSDPFLAPTYESEDSADDIEVNEQGERINVVNVPSPINVRLLDENMSLTTTLLLFSWCTEALPTSVDTEGALERGEGNVLVKKRSETIEQAAPISVDEAADSIGCHPQSPPPVVTTVESTEDCGMDVGPVKKKSDMDKQREIQAIKADLPNKTCLRRRPGHFSLDVTLGATLPLVSTAMRSVGIP